MIVNGKALLEAAPIKNMLDHKVKHSGVSHGLAEVGYDIRIKQTVEFTKGTRFPRVVLVDNEPSHGRFVLASAIEEFNMPPNLVGIVHDKSTWARKGLSVFNTVIEPSWAGFLTLELVYHGDGDLVITAGTGIAQVIFHQIIEPAHYAGKYMHQENKPVEAIFEGVN